MARIIMPIQDARPQPGACAVHRRQPDQKQPTDFDVLFAAHDAQVPDLEGEEPEPADVPADAVQEMPRTPPVAAGLDLLIAWQPASTLPPAPVSVEVERPQLSLEGMPMVAGSVIAQDTDVHHSSSSPDIPQASEFSVARTSQSKVDQDRSATPAGTEPELPRARLQDAKPDATPCTPDMPRELDSVQTREQKDTAPGASDNQAPAFSVPTTHSTSPVFQAMPSPARQLLTLLEAPLSPLRSLSAATPEQLGPGSEIKVLRMRLKPEALGEVDVTLRRHGGEMRIQIAVGKQAAADALAADLGLLRDRVGFVLGSEATHSIAIVVQSVDSPVPSPGGSHVPGPDAGQIGSGTSASRDGERPPPRKQEPPLPSDGHETHETPQLRTASTGLVV